MSHARRRARTFLDRLACMSACLLASACVTHAPDSPFGRQHRAHRLQPTAAPDGISVLWFGVTTLLFRDGDDAILIDGYLSRPPVGRLLVGGIGPDCAAAGQRLDKAGLERLGAIFVAHAHHDHVLDAPAIAARYDAPLYGSRSTLHLGSAGGARRLIEIEAGKPVTAAGFEVTAFATPHSDTLFDLAGIEAPPTYPLPALCFGAGQNYSFLVRRGDLRMLVVPSAKLEPGSFAGLASDIVFLGIGGLGREAPGAICRLWEEAVRQRRARQAILAHWDHLGQAPAEPPVTFGFPLDAVPRTHRLLQDLAGRDGIGLHYLPPSQPVALHAPAQATASPAARPPPARDCDAWAVAHGGGAIAEPN